MKLFTYAELEAPGNPPATAFGECRQRGKDLAAHFSVRGGPIHGQAQEASGARLAALDKSEAPNYRRKRIPCRVGGKLEACWAYEYTGEDWDELKPKKGS